MRIFPITIVLIILITACVPNPSVITDTLEDIPQLPDSVSTPFSQGLMTEYDVWMFLNQSPSLSEIVITLGEPDSVWVDEDLEFRILYYYIPALKDYNSVEVDIKSNQTTGFEWD